MSYYSEEQLDGICRSMQPHGLYMYRENFMWGKTPAFRDKEAKRFYFLDGGKLLTPQEQLATLRGSWRPAAADERDYAAGRMANDFADFPEVKPWEGNPPWVVNEPLKPVTHVDEVRPAPNCPDFLNPGSVALESARIMAELEGMGHDAKIARE